MAVLNKRRGEGVTAYLTFSYLGYGGRYAFEFNLVRSGVELAAGRNPFNLPAVTGAVPGPYNISTSLTIPADAPLAEYEVFCAIWSTSDDGQTNIESIWTGKADKNILVLARTTFTDPGVTV